ncbi:MAG TPA: MFS transporter [Candidatus Methylomirabilis sp.]|nr:MFS transporter [Candidatus Methylomirabilis sp.]
MSGKGFNADRGKRGNPVCRRSLLAAIPPNVGALGVVSFLTDASTEMVYPLLPLFLTHTLSAGTAFVGLVEGVAETTASLLKLFAGWLSDRLRRRKALVVWGYGLSSLTRPLMALAAAPGHVLGIRFLDRIGKGIRTSPRDALIADSTPASNRGVAFGFHRAMDHLGAVVGPLLAFALLPAVGGSYRAIFWLASLPAALCVLVLVLSVREVPAQGPPARLPLLTLRPYDRRFRRFLLILALFTLGNSSDAFLLLRARDAGVTDAAIPLLWAALHVVKSSTSVVGGILSDRIGRRSTIAAGWLVYASVYDGFALVARAQQIWGLFLVYGLYFGLTEGVEKALVADLVPAELRASAFGVYHTAIGIVALPASLLTGWLWQGFGAGFAFGTGAALAAGAAVLLVRFLDGSKPAPRQAS